MTVTPEDLRGMSDDQIYKSMLGGTYNSDHYNHCATTLNLRFSQRLSLFSKRLKGIACIFVVLFLVISGYSSAETMRTINTRNEYGGETKELVLTANDEGYKQGIAKRTSYYDNNGKVAKREFYHTDDHAKKTGEAKKIVYYDKNEKPVKGEQYFTDDYTSKSGTAKTIYYFDNNGKKVKGEKYYADDYTRKHGTAKTIHYLDNNEKEMKREIYYADDYTRKTGIAKAIANYDNNEKLVKTEVYDRNGKLLRQIFAK
jgi:hypothetical protein